jgi:hypothetical protein
MNDTVFHRWFALALLAITGLALVQEPVYRALSTTRVNNLEISGTTDATGEMTARGGVRLTTPTTGPTLTSGSGAPAGSAAKGSIYFRTDTATVHQNTDGATAWAQIGGTSGTTTVNVIQIGGTAGPTLENGTGVPASSKGKGSIFTRTDSNGGLYWNKDGATTWVPVAESLGSVSTSSSSCTSACTNVNLSTEGTIDWAWYGSINAIQPVWTPTTVPHIKRDGPRWLLWGFNYAVNAHSVTTFSQSGLRTYTTTATDDLNGSAVSTTTLQGINTPVPATPGMGFVVVIPAPGDGVSRVLRIHGQLFSIIVQCTSTLTGSGLTSNTSVNTTISTSADFIFTTTYTGDGSALKVVCVSTTNHTGGNSIKIAGATLGTT